MRSIQIYKYYGWKKIGNAVEITFPINCCCCVGHSTMTYNGIWRDKLFGTFGFFLFRLTKWKIVGKYILLFDCHPHRPEVSAYVPMFFCFVSKRNVFYPLRFKSTIFGLICSFTSNRAWHNGSHHQVKHWIYIHAVFLSSVIERRADVDL